jgi:O-succinylbenzoic acid--CoA ligase
VTAHDFGVDFARGPWLRARAAATPDREALLHAGRSISYAELLDSAEALADGLGELGVEPGDVVALLLPNGPDFVRLVHAIQLRGAILLPLNWRLTPAELGYQLRDSAARLLLHAPGEGAAAEACARAGDAAPGLAALVDGGLLAERAAPARGAGGPELEGAMALLYTSGTTGRPKGAVLGPECFLASAAASAQLLGGDADDRWLLSMPLFHVGGLSVLTRSCLAGSSALIHERFDPIALSDALDRDGVTGVSVVASMLRRLLDVRGDRPAPPSLRCVLLGGGPAPDALQRRARTLGFPLAPTYGLTEAASQVATRPPSDDREPPGARLRALPGNRLRIVDEEGHALPTGEVGEICVVGPTLMRGYLGLPRETERALRQGWLHTGDLGCLDAEGHLQVMDRRDDLIVSGGENVYPAEVEAVLESHPGVAEAGVVARADAEYGARPVAFWACAEGEPPSEAELRAHCRGALAGYKMPVSFECVDALPRNASGKLLRGRLRERIEGEAVAPVAEGG